jgi:hypothetical protein
MSSDPRIRACDTRYKYTKRARSSIYMYDTYHNDGERELLGRGHHLRRVRVRGRWDCLCEWRCECVTLWHCVCVCECERCCKVNLFQESPGYYLFSLLEYVRYEYCTILSKHKREACSKEQ